MYEPQWERDAQSSPHNVEDTMSDRGIAWTVPLSDFLVFSCDLTWPRVRAGWRACTAGRRNPPMREGAVNLVRTRRNLPTNECAILSY